MLNHSGRKRSRLALTPAAVAALVLALATAGAAQEAQPAPQPTPQTQTQPQQATPPAAEGEKTGTQVAAAAAAAAPKPAEPLYKEYRGVKLGMSADEVRAKLGKPEEKSDEMDFFVFSDSERARVYYRDKKASAVIATYIGKGSAAPASAAVLGAEIEAKPDGSMYRMVTYPQAGYWVAYSRTAGDSPMTIITMQQSP